MDCVSSERHHKGRHNDISFSFLKAQTQLKLEIGWPGLHLQTLLKHAAVPSTVLHVHSAPSHGLSYSYYLWRLWRSCHGVLTSAASAKCRRPSFTAAVKLRGNANCQLPICPCPPASNRFTRPQPPRALKVQGFTLCAFQTKCFWSFVSGLKHFIDFLIMIDNGNKNWLVYM